MTDSMQLLQAYVQTGSESAFRELVDRYVDLVYSAALRKLADVSLAEDVAQIVFTDLAMQAPTLSPKVHLGGWIYQHTCFVAANMSRTERRRQAREEMAIEMNDFNDNRDAGWQQLAPVLDEAISELSNEEREAVVLRFFEKYDFRAVGAALGISDDAAQKRVSRTLEKLRDLLIRRGVVLTPVALGTLLATEGVKAAPTGLAVTLSGTALASAKSPVAFSMQKLFAVAVAIALLTGAFMFSKTFLESSQKMAQQAPAANSDSFLSLGAPEEAMGEDQSPNLDSAEGIRAGDVVVIPATDSIASNVLHLSIVTADTGKPIPNVPLKCAMQTMTYIRTNLVSDRMGICRIKLPPRLNSIQITTQIEGFADTRLFWRPNRGESIPESYILKLIRPVWIGGKVVDHEGNPVAGAKIGWNQEGDHTPPTVPESNDFSWVEVSTDADGRWQLNRIAPQMIRRLYGHAKHSNFVNSPFLHLSQSADAEKQLRAGTHVFHLGAAYAIHGKVLDPDNQPVAGAKISVGVRRSSERRNATSLSDGSFSVIGCDPGENLLTVQADGFAPTTLTIQVAGDTPGFEVQLQRGKVLRVKVVNQRGEPVPEAAITVELLPAEPAKPSSGTVQMYHTIKANSAGRAEWTNAPDQTVAFYADARGYVRSDKMFVRADGEEHTLTLSPALTISGTVRDEYGNPVPRFRIICGYPDTIGVKWSDLSRFWLDFSNGTFKHTFREGVVGNEPEYVFKFEAEGYEDFVSRVVRRDEQNVDLSVALKKTGTPTVVTVLLPDGRPAAGADVGFGKRPSDSAERPQLLSLGTAGFSRTYSTAKIIHTDGQGRFRLPSDDSVILVVAANTDGYAEVTPLALQSDPVMRLQPWGRIEGIYRKGGQPIAEQELGLNHGTSGFAGMFLNTYEYRTKTDSHGRFIFPRVPSCSVQLSRWVSTQIASSEQQNRRMMSQWKLRTILVGAGETVEVEIEESGYRVVGLLRWPEGYSRGTNTFVSGRFHTPHIIPPAELKTQPGAEARWWQSPEVQARMQDRIFHDFRIADDSIAIPMEFPPGDYVLQVFVANAQGPDDQPTYLRVEKNVRISSEPPTGTIDLGEITLNAPAQR